MKTHLKLLALFCLQSAICFSTRAQGSLTPPGAPAPTMRTLDQIYSRVDARNPITNSSSAVTITVPGSYYLTTNLTVSSGDAITIAANNVTLDLNGFTIASIQPIATTNVAILLSAGRANISIYNGHISSGVTNANGVFGGSGFGYGINNFGTYNMRVKNVSVAGVLGSGIYLDNASRSVVEACNVDQAGGIGIFADTVSDSTATSCRSYGIYAVTANNCKGGVILGSAGLYAATANNCYGENVGGSAGLLASTANNCYGSNSGSGAGVQASVASNCYGSNSGGGYGVYANIANHCYGSNSGSGYGIYAQKVAFACNGESDGGIGLNAYNAAFCTASRPGGTALLAIIANGCIVTAGASGITYKYNMP